MSNKEQEEAEIIVTMLKNGYTFSEIEQKTGKTIAVLYKNFYNFLNYKINSVKLGHKSEPYYESEEEMITDRVYTYDSLSEEEKKIFHDL